jgi:hypothetical protein
MRISLTLIALAVASPVMAETKDVCLERWKAADLDANGSYQASLDSADYAAALTGKAN